MDIQTWVCAFHTTRFQAWVAGAPGPPCAPGGAIARLNLPPTTTSPWPATSRLSTTPSWAAWVPGCTKRTPPPTVRQLGIERGACRPGCCASAAIPGVEVPAVWVNRPPTYSQPLCGSAAMLSTCPSGPLVGLKYLHATPLVQAMNCSGSRKGCSAPPMHICVPSADSPMDRTAFSPVRNSPMGS